MDTTKNKSAIRAVVLTAMLGILNIYPIMISAQNDIFQLMDRTDLKLEEVEKLADSYFQKVGTGQGTGYKQYQRWLYERRFHTDEDGIYIRPETEDKAYYDAKRNMGLKNRSTKTWSELGPYAWNRTSGWNPGVGRVTSVAVHPSDTTVMYVTSPGGGIWKSTNSGNTWSPLVDFTNSSWMSFFHITIDPNNTSVIYACLYDGGVLKSTNAGATWTTTGSGPSSARQVKIHPSNSSIVFCAATNGLWRSTNAGTSWTQVQSAPKEDIEFNPSNPNIMYASGSSGTSCVWRSSDNGQTWTAIGSGSGITATGRTLIAVSPNDPNVVYAVQASGSIFGKFYKSTDSGLTYTALITGNPGSGTNFFGYETNGTGTTGQATYDMAITVNPQNVNEVHIAGIICWVSTNGGISFVAETAWSLPNSVGYNHADVHALEWVNRTIYSGSDGGVYKSINRGGDWSDLSSGLGIRQFYRISCSKTDANVITVGAQDNGSSFRRTNGTWVDWLGADGMDNMISPTNAAIAIGTSQNGSIYKTTNSGSSYSGLTKPAGGNWVTPLIMHPTNHDTCYGGWAGVFRSVNGGTSWSSISTGYISSNITVMDVSPANTRYIYASIGSTLYRTSDGGSTWTSVTAPASITWIHASKIDPLKIWITCNSTTNRLYVSTDGGTNFTNLSSGLPSVSARCVDVDEDQVETIYAGMNIGVYYRDNVNNTWYEHGTGLPLVAVNEVEIQKSGSKLRVATYGRGVWESDLQNTSAPCSAPGSLSSNNITSSSAVVQWNAVTGAVSYDVDYKIQSAGSWTTAVTGGTSTSVSLSGLSALTVYDWRVKTNCSGNSSSYSQGAFTTLSNCGDPQSLSLASSTSNSASLSWAAVSGANSYDLDHRIAAGSWTSVTGISSNSYSLSGLSSGKYEWRVRANCNSGSGNFVSSDFTIYCSAAGQSTTNGYIDYVTLGSISRTSGSDGGYYDGTAAYSANLKPGSSYTLSVSPGYSGSKKNIYFSVFIDYNRDGDFADAGETIAQKLTKSTGNLSISFTVPTGADLGTSRVRIAMSTASYPTYCGAYSSGEVEDYSVVLTNTPTMPDDNQMADGPKLEIYPNPAGDVLNLKLALDQDVSVVEVRILDFQGRMVGGLHTVGFAGENSKSIDLSTLSAGNYLLMVTMPGKQLTEHFVISR